LELANPPGLSSDYEVPSELVAHKTPSGLIRLRGR
jgi:hypothetical protein